MNSLQSNFSAKFKQLQILHLALVGGAVFMGCIIWFLMPNTGILATTINWFEGLPLISIIVMAVEIALSYFVWFSRQSKIPATASANEKWNHYQSSCVIRWACLQGATLITIVFAHLVQHPYIFGVSAVGLALLIIARPSKDYLMEKYGLEAY
jgi:hypothetical protein